MTEPSVETADREQLVSSIAQMIWVAVYDAGPISTAECHALAGQIVNACAATLAERNREITALRAQLAEARSVGERVGHIAGRLRNRDVTAVTASQLLEEAIRTLIEQKP